MTRVRLRKRVSHTVAAGVAAGVVLALSGCWAQDVPPLDPPELKLQVAPTYCTGLWHMPNMNFAGSLSWGVYATLVVPDDDSDLPALDGAEVMVDGLPDARASVDGGGVVVGVLPLTALGEYPITGIEVRLANGEEYSLSVDYSFEVGADGFEVTCEGDGADAERIREGIRVSPLVDF